MPGRGRRPTSASVASTPVGAKIYYYLTGEGHVRDTLQDLTELALKNPNGGQATARWARTHSFLYQWERTDDDIWRNRLKDEIERNQGLKRPRTVGT